jgi:DNA-binding Xre family transcriptional regulator
MEKCDISKRQLAIQSGVTARTVFMWLNGHSAGINLTTLVRFCLTLGVDLKLEERA